LLKNDRFHISGCPPAFYRSTINQYRNIQLVRYRNSNYRIQNRKMNREENREERRAGNEKDDNQ
jgi:hypothetical protein